MAQARIFAVANQKGGVGKTTTAVNLAASFAVCERASLLVDVDPQANATSAFGLSPTRHLYHALAGGCVVKDIALPTPLRFLNVVPSGRDLYGAEVELVQAPQRERRLEQLLRELRHAYEFIVIDCPPSLGLLTLNALAAADAVIIPLQCEYYALEGLAALLETLESVRTQLNPQLCVEGIALTMADSRNRLSSQVGQEVRRHVRERVFDTVIPRNVRLSEAPSHGKPAILYDAHSKGAVAYMKLAEEILMRHPRPSKPVAPPDLRSDTDAQTPSIVEGSGGPDGDVA